MELGEVKAVFTRAGKFIPRQRPGEYEFKYLKRLAEVTVELAFYQGNNFLRRLYSKKFHLMLFDTMQQIFYTMLKLKGKV